MCIAHFLSHTHTRARTLSTHAAPSVLPPAPVAPPVDQPAAANSLICRRVSPPRQWQPETVIQEVSRP